MNTNYQSKVQAAPFSDEIEGENTEVFLRGLLVACLLSALAICNLSVGHRVQSARASQSAMAVAKPIVETVVAPAAKL